MWIFVIFDPKLAIYSVFYKESESDVNKMPNFRARRGKLRQTNVNSFFFFENPFPAGSGQDF